MLWKQKLLFKYPNNEGEITLVSTETKFKLEKHQRVINIDRGTVNMTEYHYIPEKSI